MIAVGACLLLGAAPPLVLAPAEDPPIHFEPDIEAMKELPPTRGLGARLASRIRRRGLDARQHILARGLDRAAIEGRGGEVTAELGPIVAAYLDGRSILELAPSAELIDAPQPLRPMLDLSRVAIGADAVDEGRDLPQKFRGEGVLIAAYDSGVDLLHPDLRQVDGPSRVIALWDQSTNLECTKAMLATDACSAGDPIGHGTHVLAIAASNSPSYRGIAPAASIISVSSADFEGLIEALDYFKGIADREHMPMVINLSLGGHEGPHDGTSLEAQAIDAYPHLVVAAAGNEGDLPVHAATKLNGAAKHIALRFPVLRDVADQKAIIEIWAPAATAPVTRALVMETDGTILSQTGTIGVGLPGRMATLVNPAGNNFGVVELDAEANPNVANGKAHLRMEVTLHNWQDAPAGPGLFVVELDGAGDVDLWVDSPATQAAPVSFDADGVLKINDAFRGDTGYSVSDPATAVSAVAVSAFTTRTEFPKENGATGKVGGTIGAMASFSSHGPTLSPDKTGPKPDLAAPGYVVVAARSKTSASEDPGIVSPLYRASAGTSMAAPHVAGTVALILAAKPTATKFDLKQFLLTSANADEAVANANDPRWGAGKVDARKAMALVLGIDDGCACTAVEQREASPFALIFLVFFLRLRVKGPRVT